MLKTNLKKSIAKLMLAGVTSTLLFSSCSNQSAEEKTIADHETLIVSTEEK